MEAFGELLSIKTFRESRAELAVLRQRGVLMVATEQRDTDARNLSDYSAYAQTHERDLYAALCRRVVRLRDISEVQQEVVVLRNGEREREATLDRSERVRAQEQGNLDTAREAHREASRRKQKFVELVQIYSDEALKELERKEDAEMEEIAELRRERFEWDESHEEAA